MKEIYQDNINRASLRALGVIEEEVRINDEQADELTETICDKLNEYFGKPPWRNSIEFCSLCGLQNCKGGCFKD